MRSHFSRVRLCATLWTAAPRLLCPQDSLGKNTGVGCHFLLQNKRMSSILLKMVFFFFFFNIYFICFIWLHWVLVVACGISFPDQGSNLGPMDCKRSVLATSPPGTSQKMVFLYKSIPKCISYQCPEFWGNKRKTSHLDENK